MDRAFAVAVMLPLIGCNIFGSDVSRGYKQDSAWNTAATYTTADVRIITQRVHPVLKTPVVCTEPSPDVAKALSTAIQLQAQGGNDAPSTPELEEAAVQRRPLSNRPVAPRRSSVCVMGFSKRAKLSPTAVSGLTLTR
jgi:hypothetical protein